MKKAEKKNCRDCGQIIFLVPVSRGRIWPMNPDQTAHFLTCPNAKPREEKEKDAP